MDINTVIEQFNKQAKNAAPLGGKIKFVIDGQSILIDGNNENQVSLSDEESDCTITTDLESLMKMKSGDLNPMMAVMTGKIKISGSTGLAMKLQSLL